MVKTKRTLLAEELYNTLLLISGRTPDNTHIHCDRYNVSYMVDAMLKDKDRYHYETVKIIKKVRSKLTDAGF